MKVIIDGQRAPLQCCDFCSDDQMPAHIERLRAAYGAGVEAPKGWEIVPFGDPVPSVHREFIKGSGWAWERRFRSTMTPMWARPWGSVLAYATPIKKESP